MDAAAVSASPSMAVEETRKQKKKRLKWERIQAAKALRRQERAQGAASASGGAGVPTQINPVAGTNDESIVSKRSACREGYFKDEYLRWMVAKPRRRSALINRGYWLRLLAVRATLAQYIDLAAQAGLPCQVVVLGAGHDSAWWALSRAQRRAVHRWCELDFADVMVSKIRCIDAARDALLAEWTREWCQDGGSGCEDAAEQPLAAFVDDEGREFHCGPLHLCSADLREDDQLASVVARCGLDPALPTLLVAECVLTYVTPDEGNQAVRWFADRFGQLSLLFYGHLRPADAFGRTMQSNMSARATPLRCVTTYPTVQSVQARLRKEMPFARAHAMDLSEYLAACVTAEHRARVARLELFDEFEDWQLKCAHYFFATAHTSGVPAPLAGLQFDHTVPSAAADTPSGSPAIDPENGPTLVVAAAATTAPCCKRWAGSAVCLQYRRDAPPSVFVFGGYGVDPTRPGHQRLASLAEGKPLLSGSSSGDSWTWAPVAEASVGGICPSPRMHHRACAVHRGSHMLIWGGRAGPGQPMDDGALFCPASRRWLPLMVASDAGKGNDGSSSSSSSSLPTARWRHSLTVTRDNDSGSELILFGGRTAEGVSDELFVLHLDLKVGGRCRWERKACTGDRPAARHSHGASYAVGNDRFVILGGIDASETPFSVATIHVLALDTWQWRAVHLKGAVPPPVIPNYAMTVHHVGSGSGKDQGDAFCLVGGVSGQRIDSSDLHQVWTVLVNSAATAAVWTRQELTGLGSDSPVDAQSPSPPVLAVNHCSVALPDGRLMLVGGGGLCFSFGAFFSPPVLIGPGWQGTGSKRGHGAAALHSCSCRRRRSSSVQPRVDSPIASSQPHESALLSACEDGSFLPSPNGAALTWDQVYAERSPYKIAGWTFGDCVAKWTSGFLRAQCGDVPVTVHESAERSLNRLIKNYVIKTVPLSELIAVCWEGRDPGRHCYLRCTGQPDPRTTAADFWRDWPALAGQFVLPPALSVFFERAVVHSSVLRVSTARTRLWAHFDVMDNVLFQMRGAKRVLMWQPECAPDLYLNDSTSAVPNVASPTGQDTGDSSMSADFPNFARAFHLRRECILRPGEALVIPALWVHSVESLDESCVSLNVFWRDSDVAASEFDVHDVYGNRPLKSGAQLLAQLHPPPQQQHAAAKRPMPTLLDALKAVQKLPRKWAKFYTSQFQHQIDAMMNGS